MDDLIIFDEEDGTASIAEIITPVKTVADRSKQSTRPSHRDSFSSLTEMMKAKKSYSSIAHRSRKPQLLPAKDDCPIPDLLDSRPSWQLRSSESTQPLYQPDDFTLLGLRNDRNSTSLPSPPTPRQDGQLIDLEESIGDSLDQKGNEPIEMRLNVQNEVISLIDSNHIPDSVIVAEMNLVVESDRPTTDLQIHELEQEIGKLHFQYEAIKDDKSELSRIVCARDEDIANLQKDKSLLAQELLVKEKMLKRFSNIENEVGYLRKAIAEYKEREEAENAPNLDETQSTIRELNEKIEVLTLQRDQVVQKDTETALYIDEVKQLKLTISQKEADILDFRAQTVHISLKCSNLEDELFDLKNEASNGSVQELHTKLRESSKVFEKQKQDIQQLESRVTELKTKLLKTGNNFDLLRGGVHLVVPNSKSALPRTVFACTECYQNDFECDSKAQCNTCKTRDIKCIRWRCSLKHKLGNCPMLPCSINHDDNGWLMMKEKRPTW